jgi:N-acetylmuramic acid 6-phosphate etherase
VIVLPSGPELVAGSTRLKAGTLTKVALNMISTAAMIAAGGVHDGLMVDVVPSNEKLVERALGIIVTITGATRAEARAALDASGMRPKIAALAILTGRTPSESEALLARARGSLRRALDADRAGSS